MGLVLDFMICMCGFRASAGMIVISRDFCDECFGVGGLLVRWLVGLWASCRCGLDGEWFGGSGLA